MDNYTKIAQNNLNRLYDNLPRDLAKNLPGDQEGERFVFSAFGDRCIIEPGGIKIGDEEFPASVTCLYSNNARMFLPIDGLADVGEYCSKILELIL